MSSDNDPYVLVSPDMQATVRLGFRKELAAVDDSTERAELVDRLVDAAYQDGKALNAATNFELDDVIDLGATRSWIRRLPR